MTVGNLLRELRLEKKISQAKLARQLNWDESRVSKIERDVSDNVGIRTIEKYLSGLSFDPLEFYKVLYSK